MDEEMTLPWDEPGEPEAEQESPTERVLSVTEVNRMAKGALERFEVLVAGEVSNVSKPYAYYLYCNLRDEEAILPAIVPIRVFDALDFKLADGVSVLVRGTLSLYEKQGKYQVRVTEMSPYGVGEIQRRIEALKKKLQAEGLFADERKRALPAFPGRIGVVTSPRGAAIRDVTVTLARRFPAARVFVRGVRVQGEGAVEQICAALDLFDGAWPVDVVILARGGGSIEDLEPFSTEPVARKVASMSVPVITGIGHEPDVSVADLVADRRASTPTAAAEAAVPDRSQVTAVLAGSSSHMRRCVDRRLNVASAGLVHLRRAGVYRSPDVLLSAPMQRLERLMMALPASPARGLARARARFDGVCLRPVFRLPGQLLARRALEVEGVGARLQAAGVRSIERRRGTLERLIAKARALSPLAVLERGYSITFKAGTGEVVRDSDEVETGEGVSIRLAKGALDAQVTGKE
ncbi:MAG: exodeoxyribonuclease VII large subunit [Actinobacteria bacterium]|nr:exodeoxyribonuclease VII large subunit [Actinomycetota bacterium]